MSTPLRVNMSVQAAPEIYQAMKAIAEARGISLSTLLREVMQQYIRNQSAQRAA